MSYNIIIINKIHRIFSAHIFVYLMRNDKKVWLVFFFGLLNLVTIYKQIKWIK